MGALTRRGLRDPRTVPTEPVEVDWGHPLAAGLDALLLPMGGVPVDLVGRWGTVSAIHAPTAQQGAAGLGATFGSGAVISQAGPINPQVYTFDVFLTLPASLPGGQALCGYNQAPDGSTTTYDRVLSINASSQFQFYTYTNRANLNATAASYAGGGRHFVSAASDGSTLNLYVDGALAASWSGGGGGYGGYSANPYFLMGNNQGISTASAASNFTGTLFYAARRTIALSASLAAWLAAEPFAMLRPLR